MLTGISIEKFKSGGWGRRLAALVCVLAGLSLWLCPAAMAETANSSGNYAILIVGDESKPEMVKAEKSLIAELTRILPAKDEKNTGYKYPKARNVQVFSYHFNQERERSYCEKTLNILSEDLLFVGIIELEKRYPKRVIYRLDRLVNAKRSASDILAQTERILSVSAPATAVAAADAPAKSSAQTKAQTDTSAKGSENAAKLTKPATSAATTAASATASTAKNSGQAAPAKESKPATAEHVSKPAAVTANVNASSTDAHAASWRCQVGAFGALENARKLVNELAENGHTGRLVQIDRNGSVLYRVYVGACSSKSEAQILQNNLKSQGFSKAIVVAPEN